MDVFFFFIVIFLVSGSAGSVQNIISAVGQRVSLPCKAPNNNQNITVVSWTRQDLKEDEFVIFYRGGHFDPDNHPSYKNRVDLQDRTMKDGDVSLILTNVTFNDSGIYECYIIQTETNHRNKRSASDTESTSFISLSVFPPGSTGHVGLIAGLLVAAVIIIFAVVGVVTFRRHRKKKSPRPPPVSSQDVPSNQVV